MPVDPAWKLSCAAADAEACLHLLRTSAWMECSGTAAVVHLAAIEAGQAHCLVH